VAKHIASRRRRDIVASWIAEASVTVWIGCAISSNRPGERYGANRLFSSVPVGTRPFSPRKPSDESLGYFLSPYRAVICEIPCRLSASAGPLTASAVYPFG